MNITAADTVTAKEEWIDNKRYLYLLGLLVVPLPVLGGALAGWTGWDVFWFIAPLYFYVLIPLLDVVVGVDTSNPPATAIEVLQADAYYKRIVWIFIPLQYIVFAWGAWMFATGDLSLLAKSGLVFSVGLIGAGGIHAAHELGHKPGRLAGWLSKISLAQTGYGHFYVEHNRGHHVRVATPPDPASARYGESFYRFWLRSVFGGIRSAWNIERLRLARLGCPVWSWRNNNLQAWSLTVLLVTVLVTLFGSGILTLFFIQAVIGFSLLELVNYVEHYGLLRQTDDQGRYERVRPEHSWNSNHRVSNLMLYHLQRHSDHHANWARPYQALRHMEGAPQLPAGYSAMILVAAVPPLWRKIMDPRVEAHYGGDRSLINTGH